MKSIMEEASSIFKAIEKGWNSAGQPKEFSIKIFEEPQKNFIGMTVKPAKIGIFFSEMGQQKAAEHGKKKKSSQQEERAKAPEMAQQRPQKTRPTREKELIKKEQPRQEQPRMEREPRAADTEPKGPIWTDEMIGTVKDWMAEMLPSMNLNHVPFTINPQHFHLKIQFANNLYEDKNRQKFLFANLSNLLLTMLKRQYKRPLKGYKIVLLGTGE